MHSEIEHSKADEVLCNDFDENRLLRCWLNKLCPRNSLTSFSRTWIERRTGRVVWGTWFVVIMLRNSTPEYILFAGKRAHSRRVHLFRAVLNLPFSTLKADPSVPPHYPSYFEVPVYTINWILPGLGRARSAGAAWRSYCGTRIAPCLVLERFVKYEHKVQATNIIEHIQVCKNDMFSA